MFQNPVASCLVMATLVISGCVPVAQTLPVPRASSTRSGLSIRVVSPSGESTSQTEAQPVRAGQSFVAQVQCEGTEEVPDDGAVMIVRLVQHGHGGKRMVVETVAQSLSAQGEGGQPVFEGGLQAPQQAGTYTLEAQIGGRVVAEQTLEVQ